MKVFVVAVYFVLFSPLARGDWSKYQSLGGLGKVNFYYRVFHREGGTDIQFKVKNRNFSERRVIFEERTYYCQDGTSEQSAPATQTVPARKEVELFPDYLVCEGHGGFSSLGIILQVHSDTQQQAKKVRIFN